MPPAFLTGHLHKLDAPDCFCCCLPSQLVPACNTRDIQIQKLVIHTASNILRCEKQVSLPHCLLLCRLADRRARNSAVPTMSTHCRTAQTLLARVQLSHTKSWPKVGYIRVCSKGGNTSGAGSLELKLEVQRFLSGAGLYLSPLQDTVAVRVNVHNPATYKWESNVAFVPWAPASIVPECVQCSHSSALEPCVCCVS